MNKIIKDSAKLLSANVIAQAVGLAVYPVLSRLYSPDDFGLLNLFMSIGGVLVLLSTAEYQYAILLPKSDDKARAVTHVGMVILAALTFVLLLSVPFSNSVAALFNTPSLARFWWLMPFYVAALGLWSLLNYYYTRMRRFSLIGGFQASQSIAGAAFKVGFGGVRLPGGLIVSCVLAPLGSLIGVIICGWRKCVSLLLIRYPMTTYKQVAGEFSRFPKYSLPRSLLNSVSINLPVFMLTPVFGVTEMGFFSMAFALAFRPINMICASFYQVLFRQTADFVNRRQPILAFLMRYLVAVILITVPVFVLLYCFLPDITAWLLGKDYVVSGEYIRSLLVWLLMVLMATGINFIPDIFGKQRVMMWIEIGYLIVRVLALGLGIYIGSLMFAVRWYAYSSAIVLLCELVWFLIVAYRFDRQLYENAHIG